MWRKIWDFIRHGGLPISKWETNAIGGKVRWTLNWNLLPKEMRYLGYHEEWIPQYGTMQEFGFWYFHFYIMWVAQ